MKILLEKEIDFLRNQKSSYYVAVNFFKVTSVISQTYGSILNNKNTETLLLNEPISKRYLRFIRLGEQKN